MGMFTRLPPAIKVKDEHSARLALEKLQNKPLVAVDTETTGISRSRDRAVIMSLSDGKDRWTIWPEAIHRFSPLLQDRSRKLIMHNANFDTWMLANTGLHVYKNNRRTDYRIHDTMVMHALYNDRASHGLKSVANKMSGISMTPFNVVFNLKSNRGIKDLSEILLAPENEEITNDYASLDAWATFKVYQELRAKLNDMPTLEGSMWGYFQDYEVPFTRVLYEMESNGVLIDREILTSMKPVLEEEILEVQKWFGKETGDHNLNLNSGSKDLEFLFFGWLNRDPVSFTAEGNPQLNAAALERWSSTGCEYSKNLLKYRDLKKKLNTYVIGILDKIHTDGRIHASFNQTGARSGRLSSSDPNLQNQPPFIREAYVAPDGKRVLAKDYSQLEMRILAHRSGDETLIDAINTGKDVHCATAATMFKVPYEDVVAAKHKDDQASAKCDSEGIKYVKEEHLSAYEIELLGNRKKSKTINFGLMYGQGPKKLGISLGIDRSEAKDLINNYFATFPKITTYFKSMISAAKDDGFTTTLLGRRRQVPGIYSPYSGDRAASERVVKNSPIQGTASEICRNAMIRLWESESLASAGCDILIQVHDEVVFEVPREYEHDKDFNNEIEKCMMHPFKFDLAVPLAVDGAYANNWLGCK